MELNVTELFDIDCSEFSASRWESGLDNIGAITWRNAVAWIEARLEEEEPGDIATADRANVQDWLAGFGAWERSELAAMSDIEIRALLLQSIADNVRSIEDDPNTQECPALCQGDDGEWYFYVGE